MSGFAHIDLSRLPVPDVVEELEFAAIKQAMLADLKARDPEFAATVLESDPAVKVLEACAYREVLVRQRVNDGARAVMLASSSGADLDNLAAFYAVERQVIDPGDADAIPPVPPTFEDDETFRRRTQLAPEALTTAGSAGSYVFHGLSAGETPTAVSVESPAPGTVVVTHTFDPAGFAARVKDVSAVRTAPGEVTVSVLARAGNGTPDAALLAAVRAHLNGRYVVPLTDKVIVRAATIKAYAIKARLELYDGPDQAAVIAAARARAQAYADARHRLGDTAAVSGIEGALHAAGVKTVTLTGPEADVTAGAGEAPHCTGVTVA